MIYKPYRVAYTKNVFQYYFILYSFLQASSDSINNLQGERGGCFHTDLAKTET